MRQNNLFETKTSASAADVERIVLHALGDFQSRGKVLAGRDLPLDRLRGALRRASDVFDTEELTDETAAAALGSLGAEVTRVPPFVAKHPFRVTVSEETAAHAREVFSETMARFKQSKEDHAEGASR